MQNKVFLLGGADLEMLTIKELLSSLGYVFYDKNLTWNTALLSTYKEELTEYEMTDSMVYGLELREDIVPPKNYVLIDHHDIRSECISSLEQTARLLHIQLNRWQQLVAMNDRGYIVGMQSIGATDEEIKKIRLADRIAQGVTEQEEQLAERSIQEKRFCKDVVVVYTECEHFSPITDRLYPYGKLLVYNNESLVYYGVGCPNLVRKYQKQIEKGQVFYGGGDSGFVGFNKSSFSKDEIEEEIEKIIKIVGE